MEEQTHVQLSHAARDPCQRNDAVWLGQSVLQPLTIKTNPPKGLKVNLIQAIPRLSDGSKLCRVDSLANQGRFQHNTSRSKSDKGKNRVYTSTHRHKDEFSEERRLIIDKWDLMKPKGFFCMSRKRNYGSPQSGRNLCQLYT